MNLKAPLLVGALISASVVILTGLVMTTTKDKYSEDRTYILYGDFDDASGIRWKTRIQVNGIDVGKIGTIEHKQAADGSLKARVTFHLLKGYRIYEDAVVRKAAESLLGDYRVDIFPGSPKKRQLQPGEVISNVISRSEIDALSSKLVVVADNVGDITESLKTVLAGEQGEGSLKEILIRVERATTAIEASSQAVNKTIAANQSQLDDIVRNLNTFSGNLASSSNFAREDLKDILGDAKTLARKLNSIADSVNGVMGPSEGELKQGVASLRETLERLNNTLAHIEDVAQKINKGEGTAGKLINDPAIADSTQETLDNVAGLVAGVADLQTKVDIRSEYLVPLFSAADDPFVEPGFKQTIGVRLQPRPDKYYQVELVSDPRGEWGRTLQVERDYQRQGEEWNEGPTTMTEVNSIDYSTLKFSAMIAKRFYFLTLRLGLIESTGGMGFDLHLFDDRLELKTDLFDFDWRDQFGEPLQRFFYARIRTMAIWEFYPHVYLHAGIDDPLNEAWFSAFVGAGLRFTDEDLKSILTVAPSISTGN